MKKNIIIGVLILAAIFSACKKGTNQSLVPGAPVDFTIDITLPLYSNLQIIGGSTYIYNVGLKGIIIYRKSSSEFMAYERTCTYTGSTQCAVQVQLGGITMIDSCCGSKFLMMDGTVNTPPAAVPLTQYHTAYDGSSSLHVFN